MTDSHRVGELDSVWENNTHTTSGGCFVYFQNCWSTCLWFWRGIFQNFSTGKNLRTCLRRAAHLFFSPLQFAKEERRKNSLTSYQRFFGYRRRPAKSTTRVFFHSSDGNNDTTSKFKRQENWWISRRRRRKKSWWIEKWVKRGSQKLCDYKFLQTQKGISSSPWLPYSFDIIDLPHARGSPVF